MTHSNDNFRYIDKMKIEPVIRVRKNSSIEAHVCSMPRKMVVIEQLRDMNINFSYFQSGVPASCHRFIISIPPKGKSRDLGIFCQSCSSLERRSITIVTS
jgi:hypothetical protein